MATNKRGYKKKFIHRKIEDLFPFRAQRRRLYLESEPLCDNRDVDFMGKKQVTWLPGYRTRLSKFYGQGPFKIMGVELSFCAEDPHVHHQRLNLNIEGGNGINGMYFMKA
jgi:hypothetical protein